jgi:hypothetical protein
VDGPTFRPLPRRALDPFCAPTVKSALAPLASRILRTGCLDIANDLFLTGSFEFAEEGLVEKSVVFLMDTGAGMDLVTSQLVDSLEKKNLCSRFALLVPVQMGSVKEPNAFSVTHAVTLPCRINDRFFEHTFGIAPLPAPPHVILGKPWMEQFCPEVLDYLSSFGALEFGSPDSRHHVRKSTFTTSPPLGPTQAPDLAPPPLALPPSTNPQAAFSAGGDFSLICAVQAEEARRKDALDRATLVLTTRAALDHALEDRYLTLRTMVTSTDPGVRGLTGNQEGWLATIPEEFRRFADSVFSDQGASKLPPLRPGYDCQITLKDGAVLKTSKLYDLSREQLEVLDKLLKAELAKGFIRPSRSDSSAPVFFVRDPPSESRNLGQLRLVVDYRDLNSKVVLDDYPIPLSRQVMNDLAGADWITTFDVRSGFANLRMAPGSESATAFKTHYGLFESVVMPMGLATAPSVFQRFINSVLNPFLGVFCHAYLDDIVIHTKGSLEKHKDQVRQVLEVLHRNDLHLKPHKCQWFRKEVSFLGFHVECGKGVRMADDKLQALRATPAPRSVTDLRSFLGALGFYDRFIPHYSDVVACLTDLTKKGAPWVWSSTCQRAFDTLLASLRNDVFLAGFDPDRPIRLSTDSSDVAYGGMLEQPDDHGNWRPVLFFHHKFKDGEKGWDGPDKELYAIVFAFDRYRHFLAQPRFPVQVFSDHRNLAKFMFTSNLLKSHDGRLGRWWEALSQCNFEIQYTPGEKNVVPDFLSRYGFEASAELEPQMLLPARRFSQKALHDIESWFKRTPTAPNVRRLLEERFARGRTPSCPCRCPGLAFADHARSCGAECPMSRPHSCPGKNQNGSPNPVSAPSPASPTPDPAASALGSSATETSSPATPAKHVRFSDPLSLDIPTPSLVPSTPHGVHPPSATGRTPHGFVRPCPTSPTPPSLAPRMQRYASVSPKWSTFMQKTLASYVGTSLTDICPHPHQTRSATDKRGLGA